MRGDHVPRETTGDSEWFFGSGWLSCDKYDSEVLTSWKCVLLKESFWVSDDGFVLIG